MTTAIITFFLSLSFWIPSWAIFELSFGVVVGMGWGGESGFSGLVGLGFGRWICGVGF